MGEGREEEAVHMRREEEEVQRVGPKLNGGTTKTVCDIKRQVRSREEIFIVA